MPLVWIFLLSLTHLILFYLSNQLIAVKLLNMENVISIISVLFISLAGYMSIAFGYKSGNNKVFFTGFVLGLKFLIYLAYLFIMILFFEISNVKIFVFTFMFIYLTGTFQLSYLLQKKLKSQ
ncbi:MAG TPA: hypothetical protein EYQ86_03245 [Bacteroidetes bacterium]|nr:hypothetical protein [Bacteroidota bacterium]